MKLPEVRVQGKVTASSATAIIITPGPDTWDKHGLPGMTNVTINGAAMPLLTVGDPITVRING